MLTFFLGGGLKCQGDTLWLSNFFMTITKFLQDIFLNIFHFSGASVHMGKILICYITEKWTKKAKNGDNNKN